MILTGYNGENGAHTKARSFEISKLKNFLEKPWNSPGVTRVRDSSKSWAWRHQFQIWFDIEVS